MPITGLIFDIQRTSLHDGPGIRTTVFLKGCPLHCLWCHNPESQSRQVEISFRAEACALCGECVHACEEFAHRIVDGVHVYDRSRCKACGKCAEVCVYEAIQVTGRPQTVEEVLAVVRRDLPYYVTSGGGLTISGGEPILQPDFTLNLLKAAKSEGIHTCLDTSGVGSPRLFEQILPWVDLFLFDYKATDASLPRPPDGRLERPHPVQPGPALPPGSIHPSALSAGTGHQRYTRASRRDRRAGETLPSP